MKLSFPSASWCKILTVVHRPRLEKHYSRVYWSCHINMSHLHFCFFLLYTFRISSIWNSHCSDHATLWGVTLHNLAEDFSWNIISPLLRKCNEGECDRPSKQSGKGRKNFYMLNLTETLESWTVYGLWVLLSWKW